MMHSERIIDMGGVWRLETNFHVSRLKRGQVDLDNTEEDHRDTKYRNYPDAVFGNSRNV